MFWRYPVGRICYHTRTVSCPTLAFITLSIFVLVFMAGCASTMPHDSRNSLNNHESESSETKVNSLTRDGFIHLSSGNPDLAKMLFLRALAQAPDSTQAYIGLGDVDYQGAEYEKAYLNYDKAASLDPTNTRAMIGKTKAQRQQNKLNAAIKEINAAMAIEPNNIKVLTELAIIYDLLGKETLSAPIYREILERAPDQAASSNNVGLNYIALKQYDKAILAFERALSLDSSNTKIKNNLGTAFALRGNEEVAFSIFKDTVGEAGAYNNIGYLYITQGRLDDAERTLRKALELNPRDYEKARDNLDRVKQLRKKEPPPWE